LLFIFCINLQGGGGGGGKRISSIVHTRSCIGNLKFISLSVSIVVCASIVASNGFSNAASLNS
jgi:hypothetical protein